MCQYEHQLFDHFFPGEDPEGPSLAPLMDPLATILYDALRPRFIHLHSLEELCEIVNILTHEASCLGNVQYIALPCKIVVASHPPVPGLTPRVFFSWGLTRCCPCCCT